MDDGEKLRKMGKAKQFRKVCAILISLFFVLVIFISACSKADKPTPIFTETEGPIKLPPSSSTEFIVTKSSLTPTLQPTYSSSTVGLSGATITPWGNNNNYSQFISGTSYFPQQIAFSPFGTPNETYLYRYMTATFRLAKDNGVGYLDLDDLGDVFKGIDIQIHTITVGGETTLSLTTAMYAKDFDPAERAYQLSGNIDDYNNFIPTPIGYSYCLDHLSEFGNYKGENFISGAPFCVLTDEGRIGIVYYVPTDKFDNGDGTCNVTISLIVYQKQILSPLFPTDLPTGTLTLTPTITSIGYEPVGDLTTTPAPMITKTYIKKHFDSPMSAIIGSQSPMTISHGTKAGDVYLYRNEIITFRIYSVFMEEGVGYLNLDDLEDNRLDNSDIEISVNAGKKESLGLFFNVVNDAKDFDYAERQLELTGDEYDYLVNTPAPIDLNFCLQHLPEFSYYYGYPFFSGEPFCVLTNEGRIAIVYYVPVEILKNNDNTYNITINVTVYQKKPTIP